MKEAEEIVTSPKLKNLTSSKSMLLKQSYRKLKSLRDIENAALQEIEDANKDNKEAVSN